VQVHHKAHRSRRFADESTGLGQFMQSSACNTRCTSPALTSTIASLLLRQFLLRLTCGHSNQRRTHCMQDATRAAEMSNARSLRVPAASAQIYSCKYYGLRH
jgi:hypothetical protein